MPDGLITPMRHRAGWLGTELDRDALHWEFTPAHLAAIDELMARVESLGLPFHAIRREHFANGRRPAARPRAALRLAKVA
jgi:hypothetical protein